MSASPAVSVIIPVFNRPGKVRRAIDSVLAQTFTDFELIVIDDASTDETFQAAAAYQPRLRLERLPRNAGVSAARNQGLALARGEFIAFLDSDDYWLPGKLKLQTDFFRAHPQAMICQTQERWVRAGRPVKPKRWLKKPSGDIFLASLARCLVSPSAVMMRARLFEEAGRFDEGLPACEDYDLWLRVTARWDVPLIEEPALVKTGGHAGQLSATVPALDFYRIKSLLKIITSATLAQAQEEAARRELASKALIYAAGAKKRGRTREAGFFRELAGRATEARRELLAEFLERMGACPGSANTDSPSTASKT